MKSTWKKYLLYATYTLLASGLLYGLLQLILSGYAVTWTGFQTKTLWDWLELLIIPFVLALGAFFLNRSERAVERETANQRADLERQIAKDRQQEAALQAYLDRMSELLVEKKLQDEETNNEIRNVARIRTITILRALDAYRNKLVIDFLRDAGLITDGNSIFNRAKIEKIDLSNLDLSNIFLQGAVLKGTVLRNSNLKGANLENVNLEVGNLSQADLHKANMQRANLNKANLQRASLWEANLQEAELVEADLQGAELSYAQLKSAIFVKADLRNANFSNADLQAAQFYWNVSVPGVISKFQIIDTNLTNANLAGANLKDAKITPEQLAQARSLKGTIMPDGTVHE